MLAPSRPGSGERRRAEQRQVADRCNSLVTHFWNFSVCLFVPGGSFALVSINPMSRPLKLVGHSKPGFQGWDAEYHTQKYRLQPICTEFGGRFWDFRGDIGGEGEFPPADPCFRNSGFAGKTGNSQLGFSSFTI
jgi:hypothetical protein